MKIRKSTRDSATLKSNSKNLDKINFIDVLLFLNVCNLKSVLHKKKSFFKFHLQISRRTMRRKEFITVIDNLTFCYRYRSITEIITQTRKTKKTNGKPS